MRKPQRDQERRKRYAHQIDRDFKAAIKAKLRNAGIEWESFDYDEAVGGVVVRAKDGKRHIVRLREM